MKKRLTGKIKPLNKKKTEWLVTVNLEYDEERGFYPKVRRQFDGNSTDAAAFLRDLIDELENPEENKEEEEEQKEPEEPVQTVGEWLDYWLEAYGKTIYGWEQNTYTRNKDEVNNNLKPYAGTIPLPEFTPQHVVDLYHFLATEGKKKKVKTENGETVIVRLPLSKRSVRYAHVILNQALNEAVKLNKIRENPAKGLGPKQNKRKKSQAHKKWVVLEPPALKEFLEECRDHVDYALIHTAAYSGARESELLGLQKEYILWDKSAIKIENALHLAPEAKDGFELRDLTKSADSERIVKMSPIAMEVLKTHIAQQEAKGIDNNLVFTDDNGKPIKRTTLGSRFKKLATRLGYPKMTFNHLRHTHITILLSHGAYINEVAKRAGHSDPSITLDVYGHCLPKGDDLLVQQFDTLMGSDTSGEKVANLNSELAILEHVFS